MKVKYFNIVNDTHSKPNEARKRGDLNQVLAHLFRHLFFQLKQVFPSYIALLTVQE